MSYPKFVRIVETGPRDGLQNEKGTITTQIKVDLCDMLSDAGFPVVEAGSFVSPKWVPQMSDSSEVFSQIKRRQGTHYAALTPNMKGFEAALAAKADEVVIFGAASEAFSQRNINCSIAESIARFAPVAKAAKDHKLRLRAAVSVALGCPYQGEVAVSAVVDCVQRFLDLGADDVSICDTIGVGTPAQTRAAFEAALNVAPLEKISGHFHDTYAQALPNTLACLELGISTFDASVAGLGGCPYAKGATGNVATEDVLYMLHGMGIETGIDLDKVIAAGQMISKALGREPHSRVNRALTIKAQSRAAAQASA